MVSPSVLSNHTDIPVTSTTTFVTAPNGPANFLVAAHKDDVANYARSGNDLVVEFKDGHALRLQGSSPTARISTTSSSSRKTAGCWRSSTGH